MALLLGTKRKQPADIVPSGRWGIDFANDMISGETISDATIKVYVDDADLSNVTSKMTTGASTVVVSTVTIAFQSGIAGEDYRVEIEASTSESALLHGVFRIECRDA